MKLYKSKYLKYKSKYLKYKSKYYNLLGGNGDSPTIREQYKHYYRYNLDHQLLSLETYIIATYKVVTGNELKATQLEKKVTFIEPNLDKGAMARGGEMLFYADFINKFFPITYILNRMCDVSLFNQNANRQKINSIKSKEILIDIFDSSGDNNWHKIIPKIDELYMFNPSFEDAKLSIANLYRDLKNSAPNHIAIKNTFSSWLERYDIILFISYTNNKSDKSIEVCIGNFNINTHLSGPSYASMTLNCFIYGYLVETTPDVIRSVVRRSMEKFIAVQRGGAGAGDSDIGMYNWPPTIPGQPEDIYTSIVHWTSILLYIIISFMISMSNRGNTDKVYKMVEIRLDDHSTKLGSDAMLLLYEIVHGRLGLYQDIGFIPTDAPDIDYNRINEILDTPFKDDMVSDDSESESEWEYE